MKFAKAFIALSSLLTGLCLAGLLLGFVSTQAAVGIHTTIDSLIWPISGSNIPDTDSVSSPFGPRWQASQERYDYHPGLDIAAPVNTPVHVITDGVVTEAGWLSDDAGLGVVVYHSVPDFYSAYLHLNTTDKIVGQPVSQGEVIGLVGNSGTTDFMHLHFEIRLTPDNYQASTRNPMGYLPHPQVTTPSIHIAHLQSDLIYSPTVSLLITATRAELDVNQIRVILQDRTTGEEIDNQFVNFNERLHTGDDTLDQDGIRLIPSIFNTATVEYELGAEFYNLRGFDAFTLTARVTDLAGNTHLAIATAEDTTPPAQATDLFAQWQPNNRVQLNWTSPGDSDWIGTAAAYDIRFASAPILNSFDWYYATPLPMLPIPLPGGQIQGWTPAVSFPKPVYFALKAGDIEGNWSPISNSAQAVWLTYIPLVDHLRSTP